MRTDAAPGAATPGAAWGLVLAAGEGRRFGGRKLAAELGGRALLSHALAAVDLARLEGILAGALAVVPAGAEDLESAVREAGIEPVANTEPGAGMGRSLALGLAELARAGREPAAGAAVVVLGDQPLVRASVIGALAAAWRAERVAAVRPRYSATPQEPGHPVLLDRSVWHLAADLWGDAGFGPLLAACPEWIRTLDVRGRNPDVDTAADLEALRESF